MNEMLINNTCSFGQFFKMNNYNESEHCVAAVNYGVFQKVNMQLKHNFS